ncbi:DEAD/DEAH box helicase [Bacilli bacterium]|nr:helicase [Bacilli bacterium VT-13-104]PZD84900.1 ATP-dependent helicase [Bacilli bacterium]PZD86387.1 ATP-dependent helicase [Bacilli bacterium]PZD89881.1 ATP-dependent helicase [Bacilli bacterium]RCO05389.1 DEAD/DEAH box helicase [Bacilli bacterium]
MIEISYLHDKHLAKISIMEHSPSWQEIIRICKENSDEVEITSENTITMPWWGFLACRRALKIILKKHKLSLKLDDEARKYLKDSKSNINQYNNAVTAEPLSYSYIENKLESVGFSRKLTNEQIRNVAKLAALPAGATFSVPGAGKTTEALALYYLRKNKDTKLMVIAPKNAFGAWDQQIKDCKKDFTPKITRLEGGQQAVQQQLLKEPEIMLISYHLLPNVVDEIASYLSQYDTFLFLDESHRIKRGNQGKIGSSILKLAHLPSAKLIMSGTPLPNDMSDLIPQFNFLYPGVKANIENINEYVAPIYVRTTKGELGLGNVDYIRTPIQMSDAQRRLYDVLRSEELLAAAGLKAADRNKLRKIKKSALRMLQLTSNPSLLAKENFQHSELLKEVLEDDDSPKIKYVCNKARELAAQGEKILIWSTFVDNVELLANRLQDLGAEYIHGGVETGDENEQGTREYKIKRFHDHDDCKVLIANPAAASEGISLHTACHYAIYLDRSYNAAHFLQSVDRIHRLGLPKEINTYIEIVYCPDSVDESVYRRLNEKISIMREVLNDDSLRIEPEYADEEESEDINDADAIDYIKHLKGE